MIDWVTNFDSADEKREFYEMLKGLDGAYRIRLERKHNRRSVNQNAYYWQMLTDYIAPFMGYHSKDEAHRKLMEVFMPYMDLGEFETWSTSGLNTVEFENYMDLIRTTFLEALSFKIPLPNEVIF